MISFTAKEVADVTCGELRGSGELKISGVASLDRAGPGDLAFVTKRNVPQAAKSRAGALLTPQPVEGFEGVQIVCGDPEMAIADLLARIEQIKVPRPKGISEAASVSPGATLGRDVAVGACAVVEDGAVLGDGAIVYPLSYVGRGSSVGARTILYSHVTLYHGVTVGEDCILHSGCVIGADGFGFLQRGSGSVKLPHVAGVRVGNCVEIGANSCVDRGMLDDTTVGNGVKIDDHCIVAHNCRVGDHTIMAGFARLAGSVTVGQGVIMGGDVRVVDHVSIGDRAVLGGAATAISDVEPGAVMVGTPARPARRAMRIVALEGKLPEMHQKIIELEKEVQGLKSALAAGKGADNQS